MFLGLSLTSWLVILGVFVLATPIVGKQVARDSLRIKDSLRDHPNLTLFLFPIHYLDQDEKIEAGDCVQKYETEKYIKIMMAGEGLATLLTNLLFFIFFRFTVLSDCSCIPSEHFSVEFSPQNNIAHSRHPRHLYAGAFLLCFFNDVAYKFYRDGQSNE